MRSVVLGSLILVAVIAVASVVIYLTGFHKNFMLGQAVFLVFAIAANIGVIVWTLGRTADKNGYGGQLLNAASVGVLAGVLIVAVSWGLLTFVFPDVLAESRDAAIAFMEKSGMAEADVERQREMLARTTPMSQSIPGGIGTVITSIVSGAIVAIWRRKK